MAAAPSPAGRAGFGARLAALRLREDDAKGALAALAASADPTVRPAGGTGFTAGPQRSPATGAPLPAPTAAAVLAGPGAASAPAAVGPAPVGATVLRRHMLPAALVERRRCSWPRAGPVGRHGHAVAELRRWAPRRPTWRGRQFWSRRRTGRARSARWPIMSARRCRRPEPLDPAQQRILVRYATAAAQAGDDGDAHAVAHQATARACRAGPSVTCSAC